jgi:hypothetical protein
MRPFHEIENRKGYPKYSFKKIPLGELRDINAIYITNSVNCFEGFVKFAQWYGLGVFISKERL